MYFDNVRRIRLENVRLSNVDGENLIADHYEKLDLKNFCEG